MMYLWLAWLSFARFSHLLAVNWCVHLCTFTPGGKTCPYHILCFPLRGCSQFISSRRKSFKRPRRKIQGSLRPKFITWAPAPSPFNQRKPKKQVQSQRETKVCGKRRGFKEKNVWCLNQYSEILILLWSKTAWEEYAFKLFASFLCWYPSRAFLRLFSWLLESQDVGWQAVEWIMTWTVKWLMI